MALRNSIVTVLICLWQIALPQNSCFSLRYKEPVFTDTVLTKDLKFATADPYGLIDNQDLLLDIYEPIGDTISKRPVIVYMYGGAFLIGFKEQPPIPYYAQYYTSLGYVFVAFNYRLGFNTVLAGSPERAVYRAVQDQRAAMRYLAQRAQQFRLDTSKFIWMGSSAGCISGFHSAYMEYNEAVAFSTPIPVLDGEQLGGVDSSGNSDLSYRYVEPFAIINQWGALVDTGMIDPDERYPVVSFHGDQDNAVRYEYGYPFSYPVFPALYGSKPIHEKLDQLGVYNRLHTLEGYGHEPELTDLSLRDTILIKSKDFIYPLLRPSTGNISGVSQVCTATPVIYSVPPTQGSKYCWQISAGGSIIQNGNHFITVLWADTGQKQISVMERNYIGASGDEVSFTTYVKAKVVASFSYTATELDVQFANQSSSAETVLWNFGNGNTSSDISPAELYDSGGTYTVTLLADNGICPDTAFQTIIIDSCPQADYDFTIGANNSVVFSASNTNTIQYQWLFGDGQSLNAASPNVLHFYTQQGTYNVILIVRNGINCADTVVKQITISNVSGIEDLTNVTLDFTPQEIKLSSDDDSRKEMMIYDNTGRLMSVFNFTNHLTISTHQWTFGLYYLLVRQQNKRSVYKATTGYR